MGSIKAVLNTDGGARGNPGPAGIGFALRVSDEIVCHGGWYVGETTNNLAEYQALIWGLENAIEFGVGEIIVRADSELMVKQLLGQYRVKNEGIRPLHARANDLLGRFSLVTIQHVRRAFNKDADQYANEAMDARMGVGDYRLEPGGATQDTLF